MELSMSPVRATLLTHVGDEDFDTPLVIYFAQDFISKRKYSRALCRAHLEELC
jgi:hypothetical protein